MKGFLSAIVLAFAWALDKLGDFADWIGSNNTIPRVGRKVCSAAATGAIMAGAFLAIIVTADRVSGASAAIEERQKKIESLIAGQAALAAKMDYLSVRLVPQPKAPSARKPSPPRKVKTVKILP